MRLLQQSRVCAKFPYRSYKAILQEPNGSDYFNSEGCAKVFLLSFETFIRQESDPTALKVYKKMMPPNTKYIGGSTLEFVERWCVEYGQAERSVENYLEVSTMSQCEETGGTRA